MRLEQVQDATAAAIATADLVGETVAEAVATTREARIVLPAGKTPRLLYAELLARARAGTLDLSKVRFFQLDEYLGVAPTDVRSFHGLLRKSLLDPLRRTRQQDELLDGTAADPEAEIERHGAKLNVVGGADLVLLGIGTNGHVAFNEPGSTLGQGARVVPLAGETKAGALAEFPRGGAPTRGMTLGMREIAAARRIGLIATGGTKAAILATLFDEPPTTHRPASLLLDHPDFTVIADAQATSLLHTSLRKAAPTSRRQAGGAGTVEATAR